MTVLTFPLSATARGRLAGPLRERALFPGYRVEVDTHGLSTETMTDTGCRLGDLEPVGECMLTPGDPSPVGRTPDGVLAYAVHRGYDYLRLARGEAAVLAALLGRSEAVETEAGADLLSALLAVAAPRQLFATDDECHEARLAAAEEGKCRF